MSEKVLNAARAAELWEAVKDRSLPVKALTQAEYEALSEEEKQADILYLVDEPVWNPVPLSIQEYDTGDGWHVRKWSDGYVEMIYTFDYTSVNWITTTGGYYYNKLDGIPLPIPLTTKYLDEASLLTLKPADEASYSITRWYFGKENATLGVYIICTSNLGPGKIFTLSIRVTGRWK